jgi:uroporphyrinogen decarboxylase
MSVNDDTPLWQRLFPNLGSDPFTLSMGWDHFTYALYDDPALVRTLMELYSDWFACAVRHICALGFDFIWAGDDIAFRSGPMIPPGFFRQFFMPYFKQVAENISLPWIFHTDGNFLPLLEDLLTLGMVGPHTNEPDAVDIRQVKQLVNGRVTLVGNIDINAL